MRDPVSDQPEATTAIGLGSLAGLLDLGSGVSVVEATVADGDLRLTLSGIADPPSLVLTGDWSVDAFGHRTFGFWKAASPEPVDAASPEPVDAASPEPVDAASPADKAVAKKRS